MTTSEADSFDTWSNESYEEFENDVFLDFSCRGNEQELSDQGNESEKSRAMSLSKKGVITPPPTAKKHSFDDVIKTNGSGPCPLPYPSEPPDDENMNEIAEVKVDVHVILADGTTSDMSVNSNIPLMDLLVHIAASNKINPASYSLSVFNEETGKFQDFKANQKIGTLCVKREDHSLKPVTVQLNPKRSETRKSTGNLKSATPFEMTKRFTVNLPHSQKKLFRIPPSTTLESLQHQLCQERHFDPARYMFQLPGNPQKELNLQSTVGELNTNEINYISTVTLDGAKSMPDLSIGRSQSMRTEPPPQPLYMPTAGETKRKKGFFSFLKKDNKKGFNVQSAQGSISHDPPSSNQTRESEPAVRRKAETTARPQTMYAGSVNDQQPRAQNMYTASSERDVRRGSDSNQTKQVLSAPSLQTVKENHTQKYVKKKRAPPPPKQKASTKTVEVEINNVDLPHSSTMPLRAESRVTESITVNTNTQLAQKMHSRNSSDSSGYHELTLSGAESPDTAKIDEHFESVNFRPDTDSGVIDNRDRINGDSGIRDMSPARRKSRPSLATMETGSSQTLPLDKGKHKEVRSRSLDRPIGMKKKKAPPPPGPPPKVPEKSSNSASMERKSVTENLKKSIPEFNAENPAATSSPRPNSGRKEEAMAIDDVLNDLDDHLDDDNSRLSPGGAVMQMVDNEDITIENVEADLDKPRSLRPCSFVAPPPPDEPPPDDSEPVSYDDIIGARVDTVDKGTETSDDSASYEPGSLRSSPIHSRAESRTSVSSVNTIEDINMGFELAIAAGEQSMDLIESDNDEQEEDSGYKNEMAQFVERMSKEIKVNDQVDGPKTDGQSVWQKKKEEEEERQKEEIEKKKEDEKVVVEELVLDSLPASSTESSPRENQEETTHGDQEVSEITYDFKVETVPPQFLESDNSDRLEKTESGVDSEEFSETITENIQPFSSSTPASVSKMPIGDRVKDSELVSKDFLIGEVSYQATPVVIEEKVVEKPKPVKKEKESFVLTLDDLQNVDFSGPKKPKFQAKEKPKDLKISETKPKRENVTSPVLVLDELKSKFKSNENDDNVLVTPLRSTETKVKDRCSELSFTPNSEGEAEHMLEEKSISMMALPVMRASSARRLGDDFEKVKKKEMEKVSSEPEKVVLQDVSKKSEEANLETEKESAEVPDALVAQYEQMQKQMVVWQQQLEQNQSMLVTQNTNLDDSLQQQLNMQIQMQKQMIAQMQQSMEALKLQVQPKGAPVSDSMETQKDQEKDIIIETVAQPVQTSIPPPPPPVPQMNGSVPKDNPDSPRGKTTKQKSKPSRKFEPKLDPREELMIAIRNFGGRGALHKVTVKQTHWASGPPKTS
ncbi:hypothetical protein FSP39_009852 [Pinctada imbricata]|uniref:WH2 domain-containing protein n=1 Tax=Pinctada imbricata TaxID=66713 RepID=A0AA89C197_PINIB|nr:hypothetical protein FSP39_009852 [Pinctada imbricata]